MGTYSCPKTIVAFFQAKASTISHAGDDHRPQVAGGVRAGVLQDVGPDQAVQLQEEPAHRAALQQVRGEQGRLEDLQDQEEEELRLSCLLYAASTDLIKSSRNLAWRILLRLLGDIQPSNAMK